MLRRLVLPISWQNIGFSPWNVGDLNEVTVSSISYFYPKGVKILDFITQSTLHGDLYTGTGQFQKLGQKDQLLSLPLMGLWKNFIITWKNFQTTSHLIIYFRQTRRWCDDGDVCLALMMAGREQTNVIQQEVMSEKVSTYITRKYITGTTDIQFSMDSRDWCLLEQSPFWDVFLKLLSESRSKNTQNFHQDLKALSESVARILHDDK